MAPRGQFRRTLHTDPVTSHIDKLIETVRARFIPGTKLIRYGDGDWNDLLQPVDPTKRDWMTSAWTVVLFSSSFAATPNPSPRERTPEQAKELDALAAAMRPSSIVSGSRGIVAGYGVFLPRVANPSCCFIRARPRPLNSRSCR